MKSDHNTGPAAPGRENGAPPGTCRRRDRWRHIRLNSPMRKGCGHLLALPVSDKGITQVLEGAAATLSRPRTGRISTMGRLFMDCNDACARTIHTQRYDISGRAAFDKDLLPVDFRNGITFVSKAGEDYPLDGVNHLYARPRETRCFRCHLQWDFQRSR